MPLGFGLSLQSRAILGLSAAWSPLTLFSAGEQGGWYDPSDLTTLFQDSAGTTPVTAVEQPVGLWLDKRLGAMSALGPELSDYAAGFASTAGISGVGATVSVASGVLTATATSTDGSDRAEIPISGLTVGRTYSVVVVAARGAQGVAQSITLSTALGIPNTFITTTTLTPYRFNVQATAASGVIRVYAANAAGAIGDSVLVSSISVREVPGNHLIQPTAPNRPVYSKRYNMLLATEGFASATWLKTAGISVTANYGPAPDGSNNAFLLDSTTASTNFLYSPPTTALGGSTLDGVFRGVVHLKQGTVPGNVRLRLMGGGLTGGFADALVTWSSGVPTLTPAVGTWDAPVSVGDGWYRLSFTSATVTAADVALVVYPSNSNGIHNVQIWGFDVRRTIHAAMGMPVYQRVTTATDYDETGFLPRLRFNGSNQGMYSAASINFSATDEMTVLAGLTKLSDAAQGMVYELSADLGANNGTFYLLAPGSTGGATYRNGSRGTVAEVSLSAASFPAPRTEVLTHLADISADRNDLRANGAVVKTGTGDQGTGNYGNFVLFVGRRNNASLALNGDIFQLILRGALTSGADLTSAEQYVAARTGVTLS
jgi:hypothetical protein